MELDVINVMLDSQVSSWTKIIGSALRVLIIRRKFCLSVLNTSIIVRITLSIITSSNVLNVMKTLFPLNPLESAQP